MEKLGRTFGLVLYEHRVSRAVSGVIAPGDGPRDRVIVYVNGDKVGVIDKTHATPATVTVDLEQGDVLQLLVENLGRIDYSQQLKGQQKGIVGNVTVGKDAVLDGWSAYSLPAALTDEKAKTPQIKDGRTPVLYKGTFGLPGGREQ
ncbi:hypothetical protein J3458_016488 [Metarhizium acridum]|uniref:uncharacterized protein n=1 Tax=Metarhizium acridum TaxID=92637 RepID=UPI001C6ABB9B|nr:hypothetical protein J3458_016488 [Metarhizium acridum]